MNKKRITTICQTPIEAYKQQRSSKTNLVRQSIEDVIKPDCSAEKDPSAWKRYSAKQLRNVVK